MPGGNLAGVGRGGASDLLLCNVFIVKCIKCERLVCSMLDLLGPFYFHFMYFYCSSTEGKYWILMKRMIINTTVRLSAKEKAWKRQDTVIRQNARSGNVYAYFF